MHLSFVRSLTMDSWTSKQVEMMKQGGNAQLNEWWGKYGIAKNASVSAKYGSPAASLYKDRLVAKVENKPLPTELPKHVGPVSTVYDTTTHDSMSAGGFGATNSSKSVEPVAGESESAYVARQRQLQADARARMQAKFGKGGLGGVGSDASYNASTGSYGGGGGGGGIEAISGGLKRLGSGAVDVVGQLGDRETVAAATERVKDAWGGVVTRVSSLRDTTGSESSEGGGWATIRGLGASIGARVSDVAQKLATPDEDDGFSSMLEERRSQLGTGKQMEGLGNNNSSSPSLSSAGGGIDDLLADKPQRASSTDKVGQQNSFSRSVSFEATSTPPKKTSLNKVNSSPSSQRKTPPPADNDADFFASFGV